MNFIFNFVGRTVLERERVEGSVIFSTLQFL